MLINSEKDQAGIKIFPLLKIIFYFKNMFLYVKKTEKKNRNHKVNCLRFYQDIPLNGFIYCISFWNID